MNKETLQLIEKLAAKLGTTSEYLWSVLMKQAFISGISNLIQYAILSIAIYGLLKVHTRFSNRKNEWSYYEKEELIVLPMVMVSILLGVLLIFAFCSFESTITCFTNPQYWALEKILETIK